MGDYTKENLLQNITNSSTLTTVIFIVNKMSHLFNVIKCIFKRGHKLLLYPQLITFLINPMVDRLIPLIVTSSDDSALNSYINHLYEEFGVSQTIACICLLCCIVRAYILGKLKIIRLVAFGISESPCERLK